MTLRRSLPWFALLLMGCPEPQPPGAGGDSDDAPSGSFADTCSVGDRFEARDLGPVVTTELLGLETGVTIADNTGYRTEDGDLRLYFWAGEQGGPTTGVHSVRTWDGTDPVIEDGVRIPEPYGHPKLARATDGTFHMFHLVLDGLGSHTSPDGLAFTLLPGPRILSADAGIQRVGGMSVVAREEGGYRGYFSTLGEPGVPPDEAVDLLKSAVSDDLVTWSIDGGVRLGEGAPYLEGKRRQPFAMKRAGDCVTLIVQRVDSPPSKLYTATAEDGLTFTQEFEIGIDGWDGSEAGAGVLRLADGSHRLFYDAHSTDLGPHIRVAEFTLTE